MLSVTAEILNKMNGDKIVNWSLGIVAAIAILALLVKRYIF